VTNPTFDPNDPQLEWMWEQVDFRPAAVPGWRVLFFNSKAENGYEVTALAGWLIEERVAHDKNTGEILPHGAVPTYPWRQVIAAVHDPGCPTLSPVYQDDEHFWKILEPDQSLPSADEAAQAAGEAGLNRSPRPRPPRPV
jgi:hypothetical protein